ncbi:MAG: ribosome silencing factor [Myxococcaceae bacterium]|jgi:ribosome-associated protein|nr:ribosome silencing factor [Myxococcaceae bacterium]MCA3012138.1 ribosome silencing factor [Myxococcaceae bacterium]
MAAKKKTTRNRPEPKKKPTARRPAAKKAAKKPAAPKAGAKRAAPKKPSRAAAPRKARRAPVKRPPTKKRAAPKRAARVVNPEGLELARAVAAVALDKKADDVVLLDLTHKAGAVGYDYLVIATGGSDAQLEALKSGVEALLEARGRRPSSVEPSPDWVCLNLDDVVVHFFTPDKREMYDLEGLWSDAQRLPLT